MVQTRVLVQNRLNITFNLIDCGKFLCQRGQFAQCMNGALPAKKKKRRTSIALIFSSRVSTQTAIYPKKVQNPSLKAQRVTSKGIYWHEME